MDLRELSPILPLHFFEVELSFPKGGDITFVDDYSAYLEEDSFFEIGFAFSDRGIAIDLMVDKPFEKSIFPEVEKGDGLEFFIDTRGIQDAHLIHKYCHHFVFLPKEVDGISGVEVTRFKTGDKRELASKDHIKVKTTFGKNRYEMNVFISDTAFFGYDLSESPHIKIAYIVHRGVKENAGHFPKSQLDYNLKEHPSLWAGAKIT